MIPIIKVKQLLDKHQTLEKELSSGNVNKKDFATKSKEYSSLGSIIKSIRAYLNFENEVKEFCEVNFNITFPRIQKRNYNKL